MSTNVKKHVCFCGKEYVHRQSLTKHQKLFSNSQQKLNVCKEADCEFRYLTVHDFRQHLTKEHGFVITEEVKTFVSIADFQKWKFNLEREMKVYFQFENKSISTEGSVEYFYCNRSGRCQVGMNVNCTATMQATTHYDRTVNLYFWSTHYGHDAPLPRITIPTGDREDIGANHKERKSIICYEADCDFCYSTVQEFRDHLSEDHGFALIEEEKTFLSKVDFQQWKYNLERDTHSFFRKYKTNVTTGGTVDYFNCNRSGRYKTKSSGMRKSKSQGTCKINMNCTAAMRAKTLSDGTVQQNFCSTHYGHDAQLCHIRIPKGDREDIAENLQQEIPARKIIKQMFASEVQTLKRKHLVTKKDLHNIASANGIARTQVHPEEHISTDSSILEDLEMEQSSVILYKPQHEAAFTHPQNLQHNLKEEDFVLGIMSNFQMKMLQKFGNDIVCLDSTHGTNGYDFHLITILVIDEFSEGVPVAWMISNKETTCVLTIFFSQIKKVAGEVSPKIIMSDKAPQYYKSWVSTFDCKAKSRKLLCTWQVIKDWKEKLRSIGDKNVEDQMFKKLMSLLDEQDPEMFEELLSNMLFKMNEIEETATCLEYFQKEWVPCKEQWAKCFRLHSGINTDMYLERCHKSIKSDYLDGKQNKRVDQLFVTLIEMGQKLARQRIAKLEKGKTTWKVTEFHSRHRKALTLPISLVKQMSSTIWNVSSEPTINDTTTASHDLVYVVKKKTAKCEKPCHLYCEYCKICIHDYFCNCPDSSTKSMICKHIHLVVIRENSGKDSEHDGIDAVMADAESEAPSQFPCIETSAASSSDHVPSSTDVGTASVLASLNLGKRSMGKPSDVFLLKKDLATATQLFDSQVETCGDENMDLLLYEKNDIAAANALLTLHQSCSSITALQSSQSSAFRDINGSTSRQPARKALEKQRRLISTKKKKKRLKGQISRPSFHEKQILRPGLYYEEETDDHTYCKLKV